MASVADPAADEALSHLLEGHWGVRPWFARSAAAFGALRNSYARPERMGVDRWLAMIGAALATRPKILMLDEPMAGSNAKEIKDLMTLIRSINQERGITVIIIEHNLDIIKTADWIVDLGPEGGEAGGRLVELQQEQAREYRALARLRVEHLAGGALAVFRGG